MVIHENQVALVEGFIIGIYSAGRPISDSDMDDFNQIFDEMRRRNEELRGVDLDQP